MGALQTPTLNSEYSGGPYHGLPRTAPDRLSPSFVMGPIAAPPREGESTGWYGTYIYDSLDNLWHWFHGGTEPQEEKPETLKQISPPKPYLALEDKS